MVQAIQFYCTRNNYHTKSTMYNDWGHWYIMHAQVLVSCETLYQWCSLSFHVTNRHLWYVHTPYRKTVDTGCTVSVEIFVVYKFSWFAAEPRKLIYLETHVSTRAELQYIALRTTCRRHVHLFTTWIDTDGLVQVSKTRFLWFQHARFFCGESTLQNGLLSPR